MTYRLEFSGFGAAFGQYRITNEMLAHLVENRQFTGVSLGRTREEPGFDEFRRARPDLDEATAAFCFSAENNGLHTRYHVAPFPARRRTRHFSNEAADMAVRALDEALDQAGLNGEAIDAWLLSTVSGHAAPSMAALVKEHFLRPGHASLIRTIDGGCGAFGVTLQMATEMFASHPHMRHIAICHTDTMSAFLNNQDSYVRPTLFGDGAGAVVLSRIEPLCEEGATQGLLSVVVSNDQAFMGHLGVTVHSEIFHEPAEVKKLAVAGMVQCSKEALAKSGLSTADVDWFVPHQTGNGIISRTARMLEIPSEKVHTQTQWNYGNVSGATVLVGMWMLSRQAQLQPGQVLLGAMAGVQGDIGAFVYRVPTQERSRVARPGRLLGKRVLLAGAAGEIGRQVLSELLREGATVVATTHRTPLDLDGVEEHRVDFTDARAVDGFIARLKDQGTRFDAAILANGLSGPTALASSISLEDYENVWAVNFRSPVQLVIALQKSRMLRGTVMFLGSASEDFQVAGNAPYVASKRALHGWAASASSELRRGHIDSIYVQLGVLQASRGMAATLSPSQLRAACDLFGQASPMPTADVARRLVRGLWASKVPGTHDCRENEMTVRRDGYTFTPATSDR